MAYGTINADVIGTSVANSNLGAGNASIMKNRLINGAMVIDQRNAGALVNPAVNGSYYLDRWTVASTSASKFSIGQNAGSVTPPTGFINYLGITSLAATSLGATDQYFLQQNIEGLNCTDLAWGTANAKTVTLSFQVYSSLTGTFGGALLNSAQNRSYPFSYSIPVANTWTTISITIAGDTTGTWLTTNGTGIRVTFGLGVGSTYSGTAGSWAGSLYYSATGATSVVGTNGATFYITGVQLEVGSSATGYEYRQYGTELALCQRYYYRISPNVATGQLVPYIWAATTTTSYGSMSFPVQMRTAPTALEQDGTAGNYRLFIANTGTICSAVPAFSSATSQNILISFTVASGLVAGQAGYSTINAVTTSYLGWSAEL